MGEEDRCGRVHYEAWDGGHYDLQPKCHNAPCYRRDEINEGRRVERSEERWEERRGIRRAV
jgi:hypothetical protein